MGSPAKPGREVFQCRLRVGGEPGLHVPLTERGVERSIIDEIESDDQDRDCRRRQRHRVVMTPGRLDASSYHPSLVDHPGNHHRGEDDAASESERQEDETPPASTRLGRFNAPRFVTMRMSRTVSRHVAER